MPPGSRSPQEADACLEVQRAQWFFDDEGWLCCRTLHPLPPSSAASFWLETEARVRTTESLPNRSECAFAFDQMLAIESYLDVSVWVATDGTRLVSDEGVMLRWVGLRSRLEATEC